MMKRLSTKIAVIVVAALLLVRGAQPQATGWTILAHTMKGAAANNVVTTTGINDTGASLDILIGAYSAGGGTQTMSQFLSDSQNNTNYYFAPNEGTSTDSVGIAWIPYPTTNSSHTFTLGTQANLFPTLGVIAVSGSFCGVSVSSRATSSSSTTVQNGSLTPKFNNALVVTGFTNTTSTGSPTYSINGSFTITDQVFGAAVPSSLGAAYLIQTSLAAAAPTWTSTSSNTSNFAIQLVFEQCGSGGGETSAVFAGGS